MARTAPLALLLAGCSPSVDLARAPITAGTQSAVLLRAVASTMKIDAITLHGDEALVFGPKDGEAAVLEYDCALSSLALADGPLTPVAEGHPLPAPLRARVASLSTGDTWSEPERLPAPFDAVRIREGEDRPPGCATFDLSVVPTPLLEGSPTFLLPIAPGRLLLGSDPPRLAVVTSEGVERAVGPDVPSRAAVQRDDGELWIVGEGGRVVHGPDIDHLAEAPSATATTAGAAMALASSRGSSPFELFLVTQDGRLQRFDGAAWETVFRGAPAGAEGRVGVAWLEPGHAIAVGIAPPQIVRYERGAIILQTLPSLVREEPIVVARLDSVLVGTNQGAIYRREGTRWMPLLADRTSFVPVRHIVQLDGSIYHGGQLGLVRAIDCPNVALAMRSLESVVAHDGALVATGGRAGDAFVVFATPRRMSACGASP